MEEVVAAGGFFATVIVALVVFSPFGRAIAASVTRRSLAASPGAETHEQVEELTARVESLQQQVSELAERQDFTERLVAKERERERALDSGGQP